MVDEIKLVRQRARGEKVKQIYESEILQGAFAALDKAVMDLWRESDADEVAKRDYAYRMFITVEDLKQHLRTAMNTGSIAAHDLYELERKRNAT